MSKKLLAIVIVAVLVVGAGAFYGGMKYQLKKTASQRQQRVGQGPAGFGGARGGNNGSNGGSFIAGDITAKDDKSITIKTQDGSSKVVYFSDSTTIAKSAKGSGTDLATGQQVNANGKANSDGSIAAQNIQIRNNQ